jgi:hypothetical protein
METSRLNMSSVRLSSGNQGHTPLIGESCQTGDFISQGMFGVDVVGDLRFSGHYNIVVTLLKFLNSHGKARASTVADVQCPQSKPWRARLWGCHRMKRVFTMGVGMSENDRWHGCGCCGLGTN